MARSRSRSRDRGRRRYSSSDDSDRDRRKRDRKKKKRRSTSRHSRSSSRSERQGDRNRTRRRDRSRSKSPTRPRPTSRRQDKDKQERRGEDRKSKKDPPPPSLKERVAKLTSAAAAASLETMPADERPSADVVAQIESQGFEQQTFVSTAKNNSNSTNSEKTITDSMNQAADPHDSAIFGTSNNGSRSLLLTSNNGIYNNCHEDELLGPIFCVDQSVRNQRWLEKLKIIRERISRESK